MRKILNRLVYVSHQYGRYPEALLADCLILAYLALILVGNMGVPLTLISGVALAWYVRRVYRKIMR
jgi:hypothetical protein